MVGSWGFEACLYTFVKILAVGNKTIKVQEMVTESFGHRTGGMEWQEKLTGETAGEVKTKLFRAYKDGYKVKWNSYLNLYGPYKGDGIVSCSNYH